MPGRAAVTVLMLLLAGTLPNQIAEETPRTHIRILVPEESFVFVQKEKMKSTGMERIFESPALMAGQSYTYEISVIHAGREVSRQVRFEAGQRVEIDFRAEFEKVSSAPPQPTLKPIRPEWLPRRVWRT